MPMHNDEMDQIVKGHSSLRGDRSDTLLKFPIHLVLESLVKCSSDAVVIDTSTQRLTLINKNINKYKE